MVAENSIIDKIENDYLVLSFRSDGILHFYLKSKKEVTLEIVKETFLEVEKRVKGKMYANLITFEDYVNISPEARAYMASKEANKYTLCDAFVIKSIALNFVLKFYLKFNKPVVPTKIFSTEEKALEWLGTFVNK